MLRNILDRLKELKIKYCFEITICTLSLVMYLVLVITFSPGYLSADSISQLEQAVLGKFSDWHPVIFAYIWRILILITGNIASMLWLQLSILVLSFNFLGLIAFKKTQSKIIALFTTLSPALPFIFSISGIMWKDVFMAFMFLASMSLLVYAELFKNVLKRNILLKIYYLALGLSIIGSSFRHNAAALLLIFAMYTSYRILTTDLKKKKISLKLFTKITSMSLLAITGAFALNLFIFNVSRADDLKPEVIVYVDTIVRNTSHQEILDYGDLSLESKIYLNKLEDTCGANRTSISFCIKLDDYRAMIDKFSFEEYSQIKDLYWKSIKNHPKLYIRNQLSLMYGFLTVETPYGWHQPESSTPKFLRREIYYSLHNKDSMVDCIKCYNLAYGYYKRASLDFGFQYKPYFWIIVGMLVILYSLKFKKLLSLCLNSAAILYIISYAPFVPAYDYRYSYVSVLLIYLSILYLVIDKFKKGDTNE